MVAHTEVATIIGILSLGTEGPETSCPCRGRGLDLRIVRVEMTRPFPVRQIIWNAIPVGHGRLFVSRCGGYFLVGYSLGLGRPWLSMNLVITLSEFQQRAER